MKQQISQILLQNAPCLLLDAARLERLTSGIAEIIEKEIGSLIKFRFPCTISNQCRIVTLIKHFILSKDVYNKEIWNSRESIPYSIFTNIVLKTPNVHFLEFDVDKYFDYKVVQP